MNKIGMNITRITLLACLCVTARTYTMEIEPSSQPVQQTICFTNPTSATFTLSCIICDKKTQALRTTHHRLSPRHSLTIQPLVMKDNKAHVTVRRPNLDLELELDLENDQTLVTIINADETGFLVRDNLGYKYGADRS